MATPFHFHMQNVSRGKGHSAVAGAAYRHGEKIRDERTGELKDYSKRTDIIYSELFTPKNAPIWATDRAKLWNHVEEFENRKDSRLAKEINAAIPWQLDEKHREYLVKNFVHELTRKGLIVDVAIHGAHEHGDDRNIHAHLMITTRKLDGDEFSEAKFLELDKQLTLEKFRESWAKECAKQLERMDFQREAEQWRHGHLKLEKQKDLAIERGDLEFSEAVQQSIDEGRQHHKGKAVAEMERRGVMTLRGEEFSEERADRAELAKLEKQLSALIERAPEREFAEAAKDQTLPTLPEVAASVERAADTVEHVAAIGAEAVIELGTGIANALEGLLGGASRQAPGGAEYQPPTAAPINQPEPAVPEWRRAQDAGRTTSIEELAQDPNRQAIAENNPRQSLADLLADLKRRREKYEREEAERERGDDDDGGRERER